MHNTSSERLNLRDEDLQIIESIQKAFNVCSQQYTMKLRIAPELLGFSNKVALLLLVCSVPFVSVLMVLLNYSDMRVIFALQSISPICALVIMLLGVKNKEIQYLQQLNLIFSNLYGTIIFLYIRAYHHIL